MLHNVQYLTILVKLIKLVTALSEKDGQLLK